MAETRATIDSLQPRPQSARSLRKCVFSSNSALLLILSIFAVIALHPGVWKFDPPSLSADSLFTLSAMQRTGLVALSSVLSIVLLLAVLTKSCWLYLWAEASPGFRRACYVAPVVDVILASLLGLLSLALAPQIHYLYYQQIFAGLPDQWVIGAGIGTDQISRFLLLPDTNSIAEYASGFVLWLCIASSMLHPLVRYKNRWSIYLLLAAFLVFSMRTVYRLS